MKEQTKILCPDCGLEFITTGKDRCKSCSTRKSNCNRNNKQYVPFINLTKEQQEIILNSRAHQKESRERCSQNLQRKKHYTITSELDSLIKVCIQRRMTWRPLLDEIHKISGYEKMTQPTLKKLMLEYYPEYFDQPVPQLVSEEDKNKAIESKSSNRIKEVLVKEDKPKRTKIMADEIKEFINSIPTSEMYLEEVYEIVKLTFNKPELTSLYLRNYLTKNKIPFKRYTKEERQQRMNDARLNKKSVQYESEQEIVHEEIPLMEFNKEEQILSPLSFEQIKADVSKNNEQKLHRFKDIENEIDTVLNSNYEKYNCALANSFDMSTDKYLEMLNLLLYLAENFKVIFAKQVKQRDIMNAYQNDITHECENVELEDGNTYIQDKLHTLRNKRRDLCYNLEDLIVLRDLLENVNKNLIYRTISDLNQKKEIRANMVYKPLIDTNQLSKYDWAKEIDETSSKYDKTILVSNTNMPSYSNIVYKQNKPVEIPTIQIDPNKKCTSVYRVSCHISGAGYGVYTRWSQDYQVNSEEQALNKANKVLADLKTKKPGILITDLEAHEIPNSYRR